jgi:hypothetical protein
MQYLCFRRQSPIIHFKNHVLKSRYVIGNREDDSF